MEVLPTNNFQPDVVIGGMRIGEPVIALTSILVGIVCLYAWIRLGKTARSGDVARLSRIFFLLTAGSTFIGGLIGHAFLYAVPFEMKLPGWMLSMIAVSALEQASIIKSKTLLRPAVAKSLFWVNIVELTLALWFVSSTLWFPAVEIHSAFGFLLIVTPLEVMLWIRRKQAGSREMLYGILFLVAAVMTHILKISPSRWFCYFDIAHLLMGAAMWQMMLATERYAATGSHADAAPSQKEAA